jgi:hypothetical protein
MNGQVLVFIEETKNTIPRALDPLEVYWKSKTILIAQEFTHLGVDRHLGRSDRHPSKDLGADQLIVDIYDMF